MSIPIRDPGSSWQRSAACRNDRSSLFFPPDTGETREERRTREAQAKAVCATCSVRRECLLFALAHGERYGIWGGCDEDERRRLAVHVGTRMVG